VRRLAVAALILGLLAPAPALGLALRDMAGREVKLSSPPRRIVSLVPSVTEIVYALGGEDRLVGVTDFCDYPAAARQKRSVGGMVAPSLEVMVALRPDLVVATTGGNSDETFRHLARLGIPTYAIEVNHFTEMMDLIGRVGDLTGRQQAAGPLVATLEARIAFIRRAVAPFAAPRVLYVLWPEPLIVPGRESLITELIDAAGGRSVTADEPQGYPRFSLEAAVARAPEVIVLAQHGPGTKALPMDPWQRLASLPAIKSGRVHAVDGALMHRYGPRVVEGLEVLARLFHPEAFR